MLNQPRAILIDLILPNTKKHEALERLEELESLVQTYGGVVIVKTLQRRGTPDHRTYIGSGKVTELTALAKELKAQILVINGLLKPRQLFLLEELLKPAGVKVWDRVELILHIFSKHAKSQEALLQIELARVRHLGPRIYGMGGNELSRQGGGTGTRGIGETNTEIMKRHLKERERRLQKELDRLESMRQSQRDTRKRKDLKTLSIVGYTNAGKTTLLRTMTGRQAYVADKLFATLDTRISPLFLPTRKEIALVADTIGFIRDLPPDLISAFRSTLSETVHADILLHVIDASDPERERKIRVVQDILEQLDVHQKPTIFVFNKTDLLKEGEAEHIQEYFADHHPILLSGNTGQGLETLVERIESMINL